MDRLKRPFSLLKTSKKDEPPQDKSTEKSFRDKIDFFQNTVNSEDKRGAGKF